MIPVCLPGSEWSPSATLAQPAAQQTSPVSFSKHSVSRSSAPSARLHPSWTSITSAGAGAGTPSAPSGSPHAAPPLSPSARLRLQRPRPPGVTLTASQPCCLLADLPAASPVPAPRGTQVCVRLGVPVARRVWWSDSSAFVVIPESPASRLPPSSLLLVLVNTLSYLHSLSPASSFQNPSQGLLQAPGASRACLNHCIHHTALPLVTPLFAFPEHMFLLTPEARVSFQFSVISANAFPLLLKSF